ncbi:class I adenylate-forming enzyme family protein [Galbitalea soli]|uniref:Long-chain fatty acid--CoA ligase n=1 Tax=Galbitalea soli TaxID=1268042 RepID=A0A7C9TQ78_9MICO|nr:AMP-binding protein [Galbitalea soli]NEM91098.1 long-chain fatty acid--CoA ligase [Galbitalea soli]NYJ29786.1 acyl-CoA synthetase (AMP-forming)/AMP-acid ligase II [Galbitalea soli]
MNLALLLQKHTTLYRERLAVRLGDDEQSYGELFERACRLANGLRALGLLPGDRVATLGGNDFRSVEEIMGLVVGGFVRVSLHSLNSWDVHEYMIQHAGARALLVQQKYYEQYESEIRNLGLDAVIVRGGRDHSEIDYEALVANAPAGFPEVQIDLDAPIQLQFSSGTTGRPKAIVHTHRSWMGVTNENLLMLPPITPTDRYLAAGPLTHAANTLLFALFARGASVEVMPAFSPQAFVDLVRSRECTISILVPTMIRVISSSPEFRPDDLSNLRILLYAGSPISGETLRAASALFGPILLQTYGQSEGLPYTVLTADDHVRAGEQQEHSALLGSAGRPTPNSVVKILDDEGKSVPPGTVGEVAVWTPGRMHSVWKNPEATAKRITHDGFVLTNDLGFLDDAGYLFLRDRRDDMIISGGFNIWPAEIESALEAHRDIDQALVFGIADEKWGETPVAIVVPRAGSALTEDEVVAWVRDRLGPVKKPGHVIFRAEPLPHNAIGKISRRAVRSLYFDDTVAGFQGA